MLSSAISLQDLPHLSIYLFSWKHDFEDHVGGALVRWYRMPSIALLMQEKTWQEKVSERLPGKPEIQPSSQFGPAPNLVFGTLAASALLQAFFFYNGDHVVHCHAIHLMLEILRPSFSTCITVPNDKLMNSLRDFCMCPLPSSQPCNGAPLQ